MAEGRRILDVPDLRDRTGLFLDRREAGAVLGRLVAEAGVNDPLILAIPAGGVPVAVVVAESVDGELDVAVVSKITPPGNTEVGYGAVAFDGTLKLSRELVSMLGLRAEEVQAGMEETREKVQRRQELFRKGRPMPVMVGRTVVLVDDGLASGYTMLTAIEAVREAGPEDILVAVPTGHAGAVEKMARAGARICCANIRSGRRFAVADAYKNWRDVPEEEAVRLVENFWQERTGGEG